MYQKENEDAKHHLASSTIYNLPWSIYVPQNGCNACA